MARVIKKKTATKKKMAAGGPMGSKKGCKPGMKCKDVGRSKVSSGGKKVTKARKVQTKASSDYKKKEAAKPRRAKFTYASGTAPSYKEGGATKKKKQVGGAVKMSSKTTPGKKVKTMRSKMKTLKKAGWNPVKRKKK